jgi:hypothetical protein
MTKFDRQPSWLALKWGEEIDIVGQSPNLPQAEMVMTTSQP